MLEGIWHRARGRDEDPVATATVSRKPRRACANEVECASEWQREMLLLYARNSVRIAVFMPLLAAFLAFVHMGYKPHETHLPALWLVAVIAGEFWHRYVNHQCLREHGQNPRNTLAWFTPLLVSEVLQGVIWLSSLFVFWDPEQLGLHILVVSILMTVMAVRILVANNYLPLAVAGSGVIAIGIVLHSLFSGQAAYLALGALALLVEIFLVQLARRLQLTTRELLESRVQREKLINELQRQRDAAEEARRRAEDASRAKSRFLATMSHELRTPLNAIMGFSEIIANEMLGPVRVERYREYAGDIHRSGSYLLSLIEDVLNLSRIEAGRLELREEVVDVQAEAASAINLVHLKAQEKGVRLSLEEAARKVRLKGDSRAIRQMWINLAMNAVKFTPSGGHVGLRIRRLGGGGLALEVVDTGEGIPREELGKVMEGFARGASAERKAIDGAGLGLAIVNGLARMHDALFELESEVGKGTTARIVFPPRRVLSGPRADLFEDAPDHQEEGDRQIERELLLLTA